MQQILTDWLKSRTSMSMNLLTASYSLSPALLANEDTHLWSFPSSPNKMTTLDNRFSQSILKNQMSVNVSLR